MKEDNLEEELTYALCNGLLPILKEPEQGYPKYRVWDIDEDYIFTNVTSYDGVFKE